VETTKSITAPVLSVGSILAGGWVVERLLEEGDGLEGALCRKQSSEMAICTPLPADHPGPSLDEEQWALWGTARRILPDEQFGRVVVDEVPDGELLAARLQQGRPLSAGLHEQLVEKIRAAHRRGWTHGQLTTDRILVGDEGLTLAGWGLTLDDPIAARARDEAVLAVLAGAPASGAAEAEPGEGADATDPEEAPTDAGALRSAIRSGHLLTLRQALETWTQAGGDPGHPDAVRARDALARIEQRVDEQLGQARRLLAAGDTLGVVAACREAIRLGAEEEASPLLREARRQSRRQLGGGRLPPLRVIATLAAGGVVLLLLVIALVLGLREPPEHGALREQVEVLASLRGPRAAVSHLIALKEAGDQRQLVIDLLDESLVALGEAERQSMMNLRREAVVQGAQPRRADTAADTALARLRGLVAEGPEQPALGARLRDVLGEIDAAASVYRAAVAITEEHAVSAVDLLLAEDPAFAGPAGEAGR
jgi:hypothetical protein